MPIPLSSFFFPHLHLSAGFISRLRSRQQHRCHEAFTSETRRRGDFIATPTPKAFLPLRMLHKDTTLSSPSIMGECDFHERSYRLFAREREGGSEEAARAPTLKVKNRSTPFREGGLTRGWSEERVILERLGGARIGVVGGLPDDRLCVHFSQIRGKAFCEPHQTQNIVLEKPVVIFYSCSFYNSIQTCVKLLNTSN
ncbi:hypothetical protein CDAR_497541 [Caerostris darwini]|uniref:Uncharacterized protein n=1 Tax=Caerostris darwini TaxID=1538125 RepID=A0AAV4S1W0_9ARAC|nr:hypothetical protein CDAR_497541 [Caerostris darwini]